MAKLTLAAAALTLLPIAAIAQTQQDEAFVDSTTHVDLTSVQEGQNAVTSASNPAVRNFAQEMVQYHTDNNHTMASMLPPVPSSSTPCMTWQTRLVQETAAGPFDGAYLQATVYNHQRMVNVLQGEIQVGNDPNLKAYAQKALPTIQAHLAEAQGLLNGAPVVLPSPIVVRPTFRSGEWGLSPADQQALNDFAHRLAGLQQVVVTATGYTDTVRIGAELKRQGVPTNEVLSEKRAESVKQYLVSQGIPASEIQTRGMGPANPVASNATESGRAQNRRVEVSVDGTAPAPSSPIGPVSGIPACNE
jgi:outer membrane protein OmpA-like peptidoglycan-associated protein